MIRKILLASVPILFLFTLSMVSAQSTTNIELLAIEKNEITTIPTNSTIQLETEKIIKEIDTVLKKFSPIPDNGYIVKIPLNPSLRLENKWVNAMISEVIIIIQEEEAPYLLIFDNENRPCFFTFKKEINTLLKSLHLPL